MTSPSVEMQHKHTRDVNRPSLEHWKRRLTALPDMRLEKVESVREAIQRSGYENEQVLDGTVRRMSNDIGILCRKKTPAGSA